MLSVSAWLVLIGRRTRAYNDPVMKRTDLLRGLAALAVAGAIVVGFWWFQAPDATRVKVGQPAPPLQLTSLGATAATRLGQFRGRPVLLTMFASRCPLCEEELPRLERLHRELFKRGLVVLGVAADADASELARFVKRHELSFFVLHDPNGRALREIFGTSKLPETYLIDRDGIVRAVYQGRMRDKRDEIRQWIERQLAQAAD